MKIISFYCWQIPSNAVFTNHNFFHFNMRVFQFIKIVNVQNFLSFLLHFWWLRVPFLNLTPSKPSSTFSHLFVYRAVKKTNINLPQKMNYSKLEQTKKEMMTNLNFLTRNNEKTEKSSLIKFQKLKQKIFLKSENHFSKYKKFFRRQKK